MKTINPVTGLAFTEADVDRILGLADQFLEDWEDCQKDEHPDDRDPDCAERRREFDALRPLLLAAPALAELQGAVRIFLYAEVRNDQSYAEIIAPLLAAYQKTQETK